MNWEAIGAVSELVGTIAVVVSLIYVGLQIRQSTTVARSATRQSVTELMIENGKDLVADPHLADAFIRDLRGEQLEPVDRIRLFGRAYMAMRNWENIHYQYRTGMLTEDEWRGIRLNLEAVFEWQTIRTYWENEKQFYSRPFQKEVEAILEKASESPSVRSHAYALSARNEQQ